MFIEWLWANLATIIICTVLIAVVTAIVIYLVRGKIKGKSSCGCGCSTCSANGACHAKKSKKNK